MATRGDLIELPITHRFTPGLYIREMFVPAGTLLTSKIHKTQHPFVISMGRCSIWIPDEGWKEFAAPHGGITEPGTRRVAYIHEDMIWTTFHPTNETDLAKIEAEIIEPHNEHLEGMDLLPQGRILQLIEGGDHCHG